MGKQKKTVKKVVTPEVKKEKELSEMIREKIGQDRKSAVNAINEALKKFNMKLDVRHTIDIVPITK